MKKLRRMKRRTLLLVILVMISALGIITITPAPAKAWTEECQTAANAGWHSWGANVACIYSIIADINSEDWE